MTLTDALVRFATGPIDATPRARTVADLSAVDWAACGIAGQAEGTFATWAQNQHSTGRSPTFAALAGTAAQAALVNGTLSHALDFDDTHFAHIGHPSVVVFPAVLAAGPPDWPTMIDAVLVGIEASVRVGLYLGRDHYQRGFHQTATAGAFGACLAVARVLDLPPDRTRNALGLCATMASGLKAQFGTMGKPLNAGLAARAGVESALWARDGMTGAADGLRAFAAAHGLSTNDAAAEDLGTRWEIETLSHKFHACCHGLHATLEALRGWEGGMPETIEIATHPRWLSVCNIADPKTGLEAKFSYTQVTAMALHGIDTGDIAHFTDAVATDPALVSTRARVTVVGGDALSEMQARVTLGAADRRAVLSHDLAEPLAVEDLSRRIRAKADTLVGTAGAAAIWSAMERQDLAAYETAIFPAA